MPESCTESLCHWRKRPPTSMNGEQLQPTRGVEQIAVLGTQDVRLGVELGSGGFGTVYDAIYCKQKVAVKKVRPNVKNPTAVLQSFSAETNIPAFVHPNIIRTLAVSGKELEGELLIVMEYAGPRTLKGLIDDEREAICRRRRLSFVLDICNALQFIHDHNIVHLDVKPANILVSVRDVCRLGDFGCSQSVDPAEACDSPISPTRCCLTGTLAYRAPELLKGEPVTTGADMYSLGICLWQIYSRETPYGNENLFVVIFGVVANNLRPAIPSEGSIVSEDNDYFELMQQLWQAESNKRPTAAHTLDTLRSQYCRAVVD